MSARVLVYRLGRLGDSIVALPALWAVREHFHDARISLLSDRPSDRSGVAATEIIGGRLVDDVFSYEARTNGALAVIRLVRALRRSRFDTLVYLAPSRRTALQVWRDRLFFRLCGIRRLVGMRGPWYPASSRSFPLPELPREVDLLLARLQRDGVPVPGPGQGCMEVPVDENDDQQLHSWLAALPDDRQRPWIAIAPGSKMASKVWPVERFEQVAAGLVREFDCWPVVFGGPEDRALAERLIAKLGRGHSAAGMLNPRAAALALRRCAFYIGNDTGTMHLAAAVGLPCVAIFSSRDWPGRWHPYGERHHVFRTRISCEGCLLEACHVRGMECIMRITAEEVLQSCRAVMATLRHPAAVPGDRPDAPGATASLRR